MYVRTCTYVHTVSQKWIIEELPLLKINCCVGTLYWRSEKARIHNTEWKFICSRSGCRQRWLSGPSANTSSRKMDVFMLWSVSWPDPRTTSKCCPSTASLTWPARTSRPSRSPDQLGPISSPLSPDLTLSWLSWRVACWSTWPSLRTIRSTGSSSTRSSCQTSSHWPNTWQIVFR